MEKVGRYKMTATESKTPTSKSITRKQKFKDLMRNRTTVEQGLTFRQIFCVYPDMVENYILKHQIVRDRL